MNFMPAKLLEADASGCRVSASGMAQLDPMADGPVIQKACERALKHGVRLTHLFEMVREFRQTDTDTPVVLMGYLNPVERIGLDAFADQAAAAGVDGVLTVDMPPEEADVLGPILKARGLASIFLVAPTTSHERAATICGHGEGYLYYVALKGVTGAATLNAEDVAAHLAPLRELTDLPLCVGFGIRDGASAAEVGKVADGVIVGSALVSRIAANAENPGVIAGELKAVLSDMRSALDALS
ncbi:Tryptophan synthase alpha chain [Halomonas chromatireducens]|uniref:Tryptophan synthase alpha chain n=1 Tax=Halomonas chromatireducens TaxID=507626 RepID=A0A0X8HCZ3_9GAMM|nr:Tryptophan synthase alpha chain [Halomonas chromatireducens]